MSRKNALVNGAAGFIGFRQVLYLLKKGYRVVATDLKNSERRFAEALGRYDFLEKEKVFGERLGSHENLKHFGKNLIFIPADLTKPKELVTLFTEAREWLQEPIQKVFHIAAIFDFTAPWALLYEVNISGTKNLLEIAKVNEVEKVVLFSTGAVYKSSPLPQAENDKLGPDILYGISKAMEEEVAQWYREKEKMKILILRPAAAYGLGSRYGTFILLEMIATGRMPFIVGKPHFITASVHVEDVVRAAEFLSSLPYEEANRKFFGWGEDDSGIFNISDDTTVSMEEVLLRIAEILRPTHQTKLLHLHLPLWLIQPLVWWQEWLAKKYKVRPKIERDSLRFLEAPFLMSNKKIKSFGYQLLYPSIMDELEAVIKYYVEEGIL